MNANSFFCFFFGLIPSPFFPLCYSRLIQIFQVCRAASGKQWDVCYSHRFLLADWSSVSCFSWLQKRSCYENNALQNETFLWKCDRHVCRNRWNHLKKKSSRLIFRERFSNVLLKRIYHKVVSLLSLQDVWNWSRSDWSVKASQSCSFFLSFFSFPRLKYISFYITCLSQIKWNWKTEEAEEEECREVAFTKAWLRSSSHVSHSSHIWLELALKSQVHTRLLIFLIKAEQKRPGLPPAPLSLMSWLCSLQGNAWCFKKNDPI